MSSYEVTIDEAAVLSYMEGETVDAVLDEVGQELVSRMQGLAPVDTGYLRDHIDVEKTNGGINVVSQADYTMAVEFGTRYMTYTLSETFADVEDIAKEWMLSVPEIVAAVGTNTSGNPNIYLGMPAGSPLPSLVIYRSGGAPSGSDAPLDIARITFDCWATNRPAAKAIAKTLVAAAQSLRGSNLFVSTTGARIHGAQVLLWMFRPDTNSPQTPRYVVDVQLTVSAG